MSGRPSIGRKLALRSEAISGEVGGSLDSQSSLGMPAKIKVRKGGLDTAVA